MQGDLGSSSSYVAAFRENIMCIRSFFLRQQKNLNKVVQLKKYKLKEEYKKIIDELDFFKSKLQTIASNVTKLQYVRSVVAKRLSDHYQVFLDIEIKASLIDTDLRDTRKC